MTQNENKDVPHHVSEMDLAAEHERLVSIIRGVHRKLRKEYRTREDGDYDAVWEKHCGAEDKDSRLQYSEAMVSLASKFWTNNNTRIEWCHNFCRSYFFGGGLEKVLQKYIKKSEREGLLKDDNGDNTIVPPFSGCIRVLDVGSCYNPFLEMDDFDCTAIDLTPATKDVLECDFLKVKITQGFKHTPLVSNAFQGEQNSCCVSELVSESYDVVVFSLVLEYLPAPQQRYIFCDKAWQLLRFNGLLLIITPDSKSQHRNSAMMRSWKSALAYIGFQRIAYEKQTHLHCMAFRKVHKSAQMDGECNMQEMLYIPQDFHSYDDLSSDSDVDNPRSEEDNVLISKGFSELPFGDE